MSAVGSKRAAALAQRGFTLIELMVVLLIIGVATAGATLAFRDSSDTLLQREGQRLAALLEAGRALSRASGLPVRWQATASGFRFEGTRQGELPSAWLDADTRAASEQPLLLGPEPMIGAQSVELVRPQGQHSQRLRVATDGLHPFQVRPASQADSGAASGS